jgi:hypothetical protein
LGHSWKWFGEAAASGLLLRIVGAAFNLVAVPIALQSLGSEKFAATGVLLGFAAWLTIGGGGLGSAITMLVGAHPTVDAKVRRQIWQGAVACFAGSLLICCAAALLVPMFASQVLPEAAPDVVSDFRVASYCCLIAFAFTAASTPFEGIYAGMLRTGYCNVVRLGWQLVAIVGVLTIGQFATAMTTMSLLMILGPVGASIWFLIKGIQDFPRPAGFRFSMKEGLPLLVQGYGFLISSLAILFYGGGSLPLFALTFGPDELATATVMARIVQLYGGMLFIVLLPASIVLRQAHVARNAVRARHAFALAGGAVACGAVALGGAIVFIGERAITLWVGAPLPELNSWLLPLATLIGALGWCTTWSYLTQAVRGSLLGAKLAILEISLASLTYIVLGKYIAPSTSLYLLAVTMLACSGTLLPLLMGRDLAALARG